MDFAGVWFLISAETEVWILIGIALNLKIAFGRMIIFMVLIPWAWNVKDIFYQNYFQGRRVYFCTPVLVGSFVNLTEARVIWEDRTWIRKVSPSDWLLGMSVGRFLHSWLIWELSSPLWVAQVLDRWFWVALKKTNWDSQEDQANKQQLSTDSASIFALGPCPASPQG